VILLVAFFVRLWTKNLVTLKTPLDEAFFPIRGGRGRVVGRLHGLARGDDFAVALSSGKGVSGNF
jgi:hypothetical protein